MTLRYLAVAILLLTALLFDSSSAVSPTSQPANPSNPDLSTPKKAVAALYAAMWAGDGAGAKAIAIGSPQSLKSVEEMATLALARKRLKTAVDERFGMDQGSRLNLSMSPTPEDAAKLIADSEEHIDGDQARLSKKGSPEDTSVRLQRVNGVWRVKLDGWTLPPSFPKLVDVFDRTASEVKSGKFTTVEEVAAAFRDRMQSVQQLFADGPKRPTTRGSGSSQGEDGVKNGR